MSKDTATTIDLIIEKYRRLPDTKFLLYEAYSDSGEGKTSIVFEIRNYSVSESEKSASDSLEPENKDSKIIYGTTVFTSQIRPDKKYAVLNGRQIAERASRIKRLLSGNIVHPPGIVKTSNMHLALDCKLSSQMPENTTLSDSVVCASRENCCFRGNCPGNKRINLVSARQDGIAQKDICALQRALFKFGYADEMQYDHYGEDGRFGPRTRCALANFIKEINEIDKIYLKPQFGNYVSGSIASEIKKRCQSHWFRNQYYLLRSTYWNLEFKKKSTEIDLLSKRYHIRQLQEDLFWFRIFDTPAEQTVSSSFNPMFPGIYDIQTRDAVIKFQSEALLGGRFSPLDQNIIYVNPTFTGEVNGIVDDKTKEEIQRWHNFANGLIEHPAAVVTDKGTWTADLSAMEILSPMIGCSVLTKPEIPFKILIAAPSKIDGKSIDQQTIISNLNHFLFLLDPPDPQHPFRGVKRVFPNFETGYTIISANPISENMLEQLYSGTFGLSYEDTMVDPSFESRHYYGVNDKKEQLFQNGYGHITTATNFDKFLGSMRKTYLRNYKGLADSAAEKGMILLEVELKVNSEIKDGIYLLAVKGSKNLSPHPVRVFPKDKKTYRIAHITDLHLASRYDELKKTFNSADNYNNPNDRFREFLRSQSSSTIDIIIITGDAIDYANHHRPYDLQKVDDSILRSIMKRDHNWEMFYSIISQDPGTDIPVFISLGNHDFKHNPASIQYLCDDLNITKKQSEKYKYDTQDTNTIRDVVFGWWLNRCFGDTLFADMNAVEFYFKKICPFVNFSVSIDSLNFFIMNTGPDKKIFIDQYKITEDFDETWEYVKGVLAGDNPAPTSVGLNSKDLSWLKNSISKSPGKTNIVCMHNQIFNPHFPYACLKEIGSPWEKNWPGITEISGWGGADFVEFNGWYTHESLSALRELAGDPPRSWVPYSSSDFEFIVKKRDLLVRLNNLFRDFSSDYNRQLLKFRLQKMNDSILIPTDFINSISEYKTLVLIQGIGQDISNLNKLYELKEKNYTTCGMLEGTDQLRNLIEDGQISLILNGHIHTDMEVRCSKETNATRWYFGAYSWHPESISKINSEKNTLILSTISSGTVGYHYVPTKENDQFYDIVEYPFKKYYAYAGYRIIEIDGDGILKSFNSQMMYNARKHPRP